MKPTISTTIYWTPTLWKIWYNININNTTNPQRVYDVVGEKRERTSIQSISILKQNKITFLLEILAKNYLVQLKYQEDTEGLGVSMK